MQAVMETVPVSKSQLWASRILSGLAAAFLLLDGVMKLVKPAPVVEGTLQLGYPESVILPLGVVLTICTLLYLAPGTTTLGAILLTGYLGGAVATHVRVGGGVFPILFPVLLGAVLWGGLYLRDGRLRALTPVMSDAPTAPSKKMRWAGWILTVLPALMLVFSGVMKLAAPPAFVQEFGRLGYAPGAAFGIGILELICTALFLIPRTAMLGAILLTGYLGGAIATHLRIGDPFLPPAIIGVVLWAAVYLRDERLRALIPWRK
jgi:DoxX-like family